MIKFVVLFDEGGREVYSKRMKSFGAIYRRVFLDGSKEAIERYRVENDLPANAMVLNLVVYDTRLGEKKSEEWFWYSFIKEQFYGSREKAEEEEER